MRYKARMKHFALLLVLATASVAHAKPAKLTPKKLGKVTVGVPEGYNAAVAEKCIALDGPGSLYVIRTLTARDAFEKAEASGAERTAKDKVVCFAKKDAGESARCLVTTAAGNWVTQFVSFGKGYSKLGGADAMQAIVESIQGWDGKPYKGTSSEGSDCPTVPVD